MEMKSEDREYAKRDNTEKYMNGNNFNEEVFNQLSRNNKITNLQKKVKYVNPLYVEEGKIVDVSFKVDNPILSKFSFVLELTTSVRGDRVRGSSHSARIVKSCNPNIICLLVLKPEEKYDTYKNPKEEIKQARRIMDRINNEKMLTDIDFALTSDSLNDLIDILCEIKGRKIQKSVTVKKRLQ